MDKIKLNLDKSKKYIIACSYGPDSMALLDVAIKENINIVVAHVNYRKRDVSVFEQEQLTKYCNEHHICIYVLDLLNQEVQGNFQDWARKRRYEFFKDVLKKEHADAVLVAHNEDDVIETYLMQTKRGNFAKNYGISRENHVFGVKILRPLLHYPKQFLQDYDDKNKVPYSIDQSNLTDDYLRNKIRHTIVSKMSTEERKNIINEIKNIQEINVQFKTAFAKKEFLNLTYEQIVVLLDHYMQKVCEHRNLSEKYVLDIKSAFMSKTTHRFKITKSVWLELDYEDVFVINASRIKSYCFEVKSKYENEWLDIDFSGGAKDRGLIDLPSTFILKNCDKNDSLIIKDYASKIRRLFIDWKMPKFLREMWPGIYENSGTLLYVPRYRKNFKDEHKSKFKIDTGYFLDF